MRTNLTILSLFVMFIYLLNSCQQTEVPVRYKEFLLSDLYVGDSILHDKVNQMFNTLSDEERIAQMIFVSAGLSGKLPNEIKHLISRYKIGGVVFIDGHKDHLKQWTQDYNKHAIDADAMPLLFAIDADPEALPRYFVNAPTFAPLQSIEDHNISEAVAIETVKFLKESGVHLNLSPLCDNVHNKIYEDMVHTYSIKTQELGVAVSAKYLLPYGTNILQARRTLQFIDNDIPNIELYKRLIKSGIASIQTGHVALKNNPIYDTKGEPATMSHQFISEFLRKELAFDGLIISDAMTYSVLKNFATPAFKSVAAGCDILISPYPEDKFIASIKANMNNNPDFKQQIYESVKRIIRLKICLQLL